jgi:TRAP-type C4-dicarboxylate transport system permease small subunit
MTWVAMCVITAMMVLTCTDVVLRYFGYPIRGAYDITRVLGNVIFSLPIAYSYMKGYQVAVDSVFRRTPRVVRAIVDSIICLFSMAITLMISWRAIYLGYDLYVQGRVTDTVPIPLWPFIYIMVLGFFVYCLVLLAVHLKTLRSNREENSLKERV